MWHGEECVLGSHKMWIDQPGGGGTRMELIWILDLGFQISDSDSDLDLEQIRSIR